MEGEKLNMILAVDIGNSNIVFGVFENDSLIKSMRIKTDKTRSSDEYHMSMMSLFTTKNIKVEEIEGVIISSVVPSLTLVLSDAIFQITHRYPLVVGPGIKTGLPIRTDSANEVGADLICGSVGAKELYGYPILIVDFGTATKIDVTAITADAQSIAIPLTNDINSNNIVARVRGAKHFYHNSGSEFVAYPDNGINTNQGGTVFTLNNTLFAVEPIGTPAYLDGFQVVDLTNNKVVATHDAQFTTAAAAPNANCITAEITDDLTAILYQYVPGQIAAQYTFALTTSGIEGISLEAKPTISVANKVLTVKGVEVADIIIYSTTGVINAHQSNSNSIDLSHLKGTYIAVATDKNGNRITHKVVL